MSALTIDLVFTIAACLGLLGMLAGTAAILPWSERELDEVEGDLDAAGELLANAAHLGRAPIRT